MKLVAATLLAAMAATPALMTPALAQSVASTPDQTALPSPQANPNVDTQTANADTARQNFYQDKLSAAQAQAQADSAIANRDAAEAQADQDRADQRNAQMNQ